MLECSFWDSCSYSLPFWVPNCSRLRVLVGRLPVLSCIFLILENMTSGSLSIRRRPLNEIIVLVAAFVMGNFADCAMTIYPRCTFWHAYSRSHHHHRRRPCHRIHPKWYIPFDVHIAQQPRQMSSGLTERWSIPMSSYSPTQLSNTVNK